MTKINIEEWFSSPNRWEKEHECLNMENINEKPCTYEGSLEDWIKELTTFIFLYPKEWNRILSEYKTIHSKQKLHIPFKQCTFSGNSEHLNPIF